MVYEISGHVETVQQLRLPIKEAYGMSIDLLAFVATRRSICRSMGDVTDQPGEILNLLAIMSMKDG